MLGFRLIGSSLHTLEWNRSTSISPGIRGVWMRVSATHVIECTNIFSRCVCVLVLLRLFLASTLLGQVVYVGKAPSKSELKAFCERVETIQPNLELQETTHIKGSISADGAYPLPNSPLELRKYVSSRKQTQVKTVRTDGTGKFDLGMVEPGSYRLLASPSRDLKQPNDLKCGGDGQCELEITLHANNSDMPESVCPIR